MEIFSVLTAEIVDVLLAFLHTADVVIEGGIVGEVVGCEPTGQNCEFIAVGMVFNDAQLDVLLEVLPEFVESIHLLLICRFILSVDLLVLVLLVF